MFEYKTNGKKRKSPPSSDPQFGLDRWAASSEEATTLSTEAKSPPSNGFPDLQGQDAFDFVMKRRSSKILFRAFDALVSGKASTASVLQIYYKLLEARIEGEIERYINYGSNKQYRKQIDIHRQALSSSVDHLMDMRIKLWCVLKKIELNEVEKVVQLELLAKGSLNLLLHVPDPETDIFPLVFAINNNLVFLSRFLLNALKECHVGCNQVEFGLIAAIASKNPSFIKQFPVDQVRGKSLLFQLSFKNDAHEIYRYLLALTPKTKEERETHFLLAARAGAVNVIRECFSKESKDPQLNDKALLTAAKHNHAAVVRCLRQNNPVKNSHEHFCALMKILAEDSVMPETLRAFLNGGERDVRDVVSRYFDAGEKASPLILAVKNKRKDLVHFLMEKKAEHKHRDHSDRNALDYADLNKDDPEMLALLLHYVHKDVTVPAVGFYRPVPPAVAPEGDGVQSPVAYGARR